MIAPWVGQYQEIPFTDKGRNHAGCDCWGLVRLVWREQFGLELPSYVEGYSSALERDEISRLLRHNMADWRPVEETPRIGDGVLLRILGQPWHVGVYVGDGWFLHIHEGIDSVIERLDCLNWRHRIIGYYRHVSMF